MMTQPATTQALVLKNAYEVLNRISSNNRGSLGLHPAVYFYNEKGQYSRFLFLGMVSVIQDKLRNNNSIRFKQFTYARKRVEEFLISNKSIIGMILQNLAKGQRVLKIRDLIESLVIQFKDDKQVTIEEALTTLGLIGRIVDVRVMQASPGISDDRQPFT